MDTVRRIARYVVWIFVAVLPVLATVFAVRSASRLDRITWAPTAGIGLELWSGHGCIGVELVRQSVRRSFRRGVHLRSSPLPAQTTARYFWYLDTFAGRRGLLGAWHAREFLADLRGTTRQTTDIAAAPAWAVAAVSATPLLVVLAGHARRRRSRKTRRCSDGHGVRAATVAVPSKRCWR